MDPWDRLLVGDRAARRDLAGPRAATAHIPRLSRQVFEQGNEEGMSSPLSGIGSPPYYNLSASSPRALDFRQKLAASSTFSPNRGMTLQPASRGKGAVIWRPDGAGARPQQCASFGAGSGFGQPHWKSVLGSGNARRQGAHTIEHRELWTRADDPLYDDLIYADCLSARGNKPLPAQNSSDQQVHRSPARSTLLCPPPLPLHDFSKDRRDALPQTGHLQLLPAPKHRRGLTDERAEGMVELSQERRAALREERRQSMAMRMESNRQIEVFNSVKGRNIKLVPENEVEWRLNGSCGPGAGAHDNKVQLEEDELPSIVRVMQPGYSPCDASDTTLVFESRFECGNLRKAYKIHDNEYDLELSPDIKTRGHTQWFYFSVRNMRKGKTYTINITNFCKRDSLYSTGLRPLMYSETRARHDGQGWSRCGANICYFQNPKSNGGRSAGTTGCGSGEHCNRDDDQNDKPGHSCKREETRFTLSFDVVFPYDRDTVYLAHCFPFSYRDLQEHLDSLQADARGRKLMKRRVLAKTIANNDLEVLTITSSDGTAEEQLARPVIVMSARVHPGETNSSWMMKGILDFLTDPDDPVATALCEMCEFRIVPMLNPDGVINGNYRCNLAGFDLNRHWKHPSPELHPTIFAHKTMVQQLCRCVSMPVPSKMHVHLFLPPTWP